MHCFGETTFKLTNLLLNGVHCVFLLYFSLNLPFLDSKPESLEAHKIKMAFFTYSTLTEIGRRLVSHYFLLTEEELTMWEEDPESFGSSPSAKSLNLFRLISTCSMCRVHSFVPGKTIISGGDWVCSSLVLKCLGQA